MLIRKLDVFQTRNAVANRRKPAAEEERSFEAEEELAVAERAKPAARSATPLLHLVIGW